jgi:hypothetical protein
MGCGDGGPGGRPSRAARRLRALLPRAQVGADDDAQALPKLHPTRDKNDLRETGGRASGLSLTLTV